MPVNPHYFGRFFLHSAGQGSLPQACPVCLHEPVSKDDCRPNKVLRTTIKAFLKRKGIERDEVRKKKQLAQAVITPTTPATPTLQDAPTRQSSLPLAIQAPDSQSLAKDSALETQNKLQDVKPLINSDNSQAPSGVDIPKQSIEVCNSIAPFLRLIFDRIVHSHRDLRGELLPNRQMPRMFRRTSGQRAKQRNGKTKRRM